jgi:hypothetical protein
MVAWPFANGPGYPYLRYDYENGEAGEFYDPLEPRDLSANNNGLAILPSMDPIAFYVPTD